MFMPVAVTCMVGGTCFFWGGVVTESKDECLKKIGAVEAVANNNKDISAVQTDCLEVRFTYDKDKKAVIYK
jgi:hypothetical protein